MTKNRRGRARHAPILVRVERLSRVYYRRSPRGGRLAIRALDGIDLAIPGGTIFALVGESGSGKSTVARCLALLEEPTAGEIHFGEHTLSQLTRRERRALRPRIQLIFQDPGTAINPRFSVLEAVAEPLRVARSGRAERERRALELLGEVGVDAGSASRPAMELSGGQRQRLVIARSLAAEPRMLILDEALASLDLSLSAQIVNLLLALKDRHGLTYLLISHDLRMVAHLADEVAVLDRGRLVERAAARELIERPRHPATRALVSSALG